MKLSYGIVAALTLVALASRGQEFKLAKNTGKLVIKEVNHVTVEGYDGNEIVFSSLDGHHRRDDRSAGLKSINSMGLEDNTGLGISVLDKGTSYEVYQLKKMDGPHVKIMVPKGVTVSYEHTSPYGGDAEFRNLQSPIEVSTVHNGVRLVNDSGNVLVKTVHGEVDAVFDTELRSPVEISSQHGLVDVTVPSSTRADVTLSTRWGEIFVDPSLQLEIPKKGEWVKYGANDVEGKINNGGQTLVLSSAHSNIYLRKR